jgi:large subunit ribosomal protein L23
MKKSPYSIVKHQHITEKTRVLQELKNCESNPSVKRCESPKYVFIVAPDANKREIAEAVEQIYEAKKIKVTAVNTINVKGKARRVRGKLGFTAGFKKAIVTLEKGDSLDEI